MTVSSKEEGVWSYTSDGRQETCGLYLVTIPDMVVELEILDMNVNCEDGLVVVRRERSSSLFISSSSRCLTAGS